MGFVLLAVALVYGGGVWYSMTRANYLGNPWYWPYYVFKNLHDKPDVEE